MFNLKAKNTDTQLRVPHTMNLPSRINKGFNMCASISNTEHLYIGYIFHIKGGGVNILMERGWKH